MSPLSLRQSIVIALAVFNLVSPSDTNAQHRSVELPPVQKITLSANSPTVVSTVAEALREKFFRFATILPVSEATESSTPSLRIALAEQMPRPLPAGLPDDGPWMYAKIGDGGEGLLLASEANFLYALYGLVEERLLGGDLSELSEGLLVQPQFDWLTGREDIHLSRLGYLKKRSDPVNFEDIEASFREAARLGCTHVVVNEPAGRLPPEDGPAGEIYFRFYAYALDFDQYVETKLNKGTYPRELLDGNLGLLKRLAKLADKYGLTPGMYIANPRSVPESLLARYPFLRGARIDHTYRAFKPRYTLSTAHPAVRWHYADMLKQLLTEVPELGFVITLINDSGSGFEYTASLYPGRNGGPYVVREWRPDEEIAQAAAENVIRYYRTLRDAAHEINPGFRIQTGLKNIAEEAEIILDGLDDGIDIRMRSQRSDYDEEWHKTMAEFRERGSEMTGQGRAKGSPIIVGVPNPWNTYRKLAALKAAGYEHVGVAMDPSYLVQSDVNREILRAFQLTPEMSVDEVIALFAREQVGNVFADQLVDIWKEADKAVAAAPTLPLYGGQGFVWYRFWVRPFVPDISKIPESERAYYEDYMLSIFNNPHNIDFGADALWQIHDTSESDENVARFDRDVWAPLALAIAKAERAYESTTTGSRAQTIFAETRDRLRAYKAYSRTLRNISAWIAGVHGYLAAEDDDERDRRLRMVNGMVDDELSNARELLALWESSTVDFIPITESGETMHTYGTNMGDLIRKKIALMETYGHYPPYIDPDYMWRMPEGSELTEEEYLGY